MAQKLLFVHSEEKLKKDNRGVLYTDGSYNIDIWKRYEIFADLVTVAMRVEKTEYTVEEATAKYNVLPNYKILELHNLKENVRSFISLRKRIENTQNIKRAVKEADIVIVRLLGDGSAIRCAKKLGKTCIVEVVSCAFDAYWNQGILGKILAVPMFFKMKKDVKNASNVIYVTNSFLQRRYPNREKTIYISDVEIGKNGQDVLANRLNRIEKKSKSPMVLGTLGGIDVKFKGHEYVIKALAKLKQKGKCDFCYKIAGNGNGNRLRRLISKYNLENEVEICGSIPHNEVYAWLDNIDIYALPSKAEGLPRSMIEAMSRGVCCIGTDVGGISELINPENVISKRNSVKEIVNFLENISKDKLRKSAFENFERAKEFEASILNGKRVQFFEECLEGK